MGNGWTVIQTVRITQYYTLRNLGGTTVRINSDFGMNFGTHCRALFRIRVNIWSYSTDLKGG